MESQQNDKALNLAKQALESHAKETQDKFGGPENSSVVTAQIVVPSQVGKKAEEVCNVVSLESLYKFGDKCWMRKDVTRFIDWIYNSSEALDW